MVVIQLVPASNEDVIVFFIVDQLHFADAAFLRSLFKFFVDAKADVQIGRPVGKEIRVPGPGVGVPFDVYCAFFGPGVPEELFAQLRFVVAHFNELAETLVSADDVSVFVNYQDINGIGMTKTLTLATLIALVSSALNKPTLSSIAILGEISISGIIQRVEELANVLQVCLDSGAKKVLLPATSVADLGTVPADLIGAFSLVFYTSAQEAVFKALGVE